MTDSESYSATDSELLNMDWMFRQARAYLAFGDQVRLFTDRVGQATDAETDWSRALQQHFSELKAAIAASAADPKVNPELAQLWLLLVEFWSEAAKSLNGIVGPWMESIRGTPAWRDYQAVQSDYFTQLRQSAIAALELMEQRLNERTAEGKAAESLRELYNLWVECNEETYGRLLRSPEYSELNGRLLNALLRCCAKQGPSS